MTLPITGLDVVRRRLPVKTLTTTYGDALPHRDYVFVRVRAGGWTGYGEASCLTPFTGETAASVEVQIREHVAPLILGQDAFALEPLHQRLEQELPRNPTALAAVDMALHDLVGRATGRPAVDLLGGRFHAALAVAGAVGIEEPDVTAELARRAVAAGARALKLKVGRDLDRDVRAVAAVRDAVGPGIALRLDANNALTAAEALALARAVARYEPQYLEQPVAGWDVEGLAEVRRRSPVPIAADESCTDVGAALRLIQHRAADVFVVKLVKAGGLTPARMIARLAALHGIRCTVTSPFETTVGAAANIHLAAACGNLSGPVEIIPPGSIAGDPAGAGAAGFGEAGSYRVHVPERPGLGVDLPEALFEGGEVNG